LLAGCGGGHRATPAPKPPRIPADVATKLAADADRIAGAPTHSCAARSAANTLQTDVIAAINMRRIPARYQETLTNTANSLVTRLSVCTERVAHPKHKKKEKDKHKKEHD
jgi:hypothetical protein